MDSHVVKLVQAWPKVQQREGIRPDCCILASRTGHEVLRELGVASNVYTCQLLVFNDQGWDLMEAGVPHSEWPDQAWSIGVGMDPLNEVGRWNGHMMLHVGDELIDLSASQLNRPGRIEISGPLVLPYVVETGMTRFGPVRILVNRTHVRNYRHANDWRVNWKPLVPKVLAEMGEM
jgi:hypothetical protein